MIGGCATFICSLQLIVLLALNPMEQFKALFAEQAANNAFPALPPAIIWVIDHLTGIIGAMLVFSVLTCVISIALLHRKNWARVAFIVLLLASVLLNFAGIGFAYAMTPMLTSIGAQIPGEFKSQMDQWTTMSMILNGVLTLALSIALLWLAKKLTAREIRREFGAE